MQFMKKYQTCNSKVRKRQRDQVALIPCMEKMTSKFKSLTFF